MILLALTIADLAPFLMFLLVMGGSWYLLTLISQRNSQAEERLERLGRPKSLVEIEDLAKGDDRQRYAGLKDAISNLGRGLEPQSELEKNQIKVKLANAGFRSDTALAIYQGCRVLGLLLGIAVAVGIMYFGTGFNLKGIQYGVGAAAFLFFFPQVALWQIRTTRQKEIFLTLPDSLDLLVVCVESGLGLDAALRKVTEEMKDHSKVLCEEFSLANLQLQMGRPRREVLHDLGVRTGVDDVRALVAILIQADRFGASIAQALRVQSDSMRTRRRQIAEEKASKTAVQLIFPLVLFIFPAIFVVLVGPAAIQISKGLLKN